MINREYKSTLFTRLLSAEEYREDLLGLYNVLNGSDYKNPDEIEITTIENALFMGKKNDMSFLLDATMNLYEHQSTINPNMPLRGVLYFSKLYAKYIKERGFNEYGKALIKLPTPSYYVFYNGNDSMPDKTVMRLSDAFTGTERNNNYEWTAVMLNINAGHNENILKACRVLKDYSVFIDKMRKKVAEGVPLEPAARIVVKWCRENNVLSDFLAKHEAEVYEVIFEEFDEKKYIDAVREESKEETILSLLKDSVISAGVAAERLNLTEAEILEKLNNIN